VWEALQKAQTQLLTEFSPDGFNIGINDILAAGLTAVDSLIQRTRQSLKKSLSPYL
jgi:diadenosine tetraphosphate (Ap4A) HIT family hydrolase